MMRKPDADESLYDQNSIQVVSLEESTTESSSLLPHHRHRTTVNYNERADEAESLTHNAVPHILSRHVSDHWDNYVNAVETHPLLTKSLTAVCLFGAADGFAQGLEHVRGVSAVKGLDWLRVARFAAFGLFGAPWSHYYFHWLDHCMPPTPNPWSITTLQKVFIDQFIQAPILLAIMICALSLMKGEGIAGMKKDMEDSFLQALIANCEYAVMLGRSVFRSTALVRPAHTDLILFLFRPLRQGNYGYQLR